MQFDQSEIPALLRELETANGVTDAVGDRQGVINASASFRASRYRLGMALSAYKTHFPHGSWLTALDGVGAAVGIKARTLRDIIHDYKQVADLPAEVIADLESKGIDPAAKKNRNLVSIASGDGFNIATESDNATDEDDQEPDGDNSCHDEELVAAHERRVLKVRDALQSLLANVPPNRKVEVFRQATGEAAHVLIGPNVSFTITPLEPSIDLSGRRRKQVA